MNTTMTKIDLKEGPVAVTALPAPEPRPLVWHYTVGAKLDGILATGFLMPATTGISAGEKPVVWFSLNQEWEPTATKGVIGAEGIRRQATLDEMWSMGDGLFRFGIEPRKLLCGSEIARAARMSRATWGSLLRGAIAMGATPSVWFGHVGALPIAGLTLQARSSPGGRWKTVPAMERSAA